MITEIYLVRHAHSDYSSGDEETRTLSERGRIDALAVTELLLKQRIQVVCSSPYVRAVQTVEGIAHALSVPMDLDERFRERIFAERSYIVEDRLEAMVRGFTEPDLTFPGGESNRDVKRRGISAMNWVLKAYRGKRVAIGIHGGIMTLIMHHYDPRFGSDFLLELPKPDIYKLAFDDDTYNGVQKIGAFGDKSI